MVKYSYDRTSSGPKRTEAELLALTSKLPQSVMYKGKRYAKTGKVGESHSTGLAAAEYRCYGESGDEDDRIWMDTRRRISEF